MIYSLGVDFLINETHQSSLIIRALILTIILDHYYESINGMLR